MASVFRDKACLVCSLLNILIGSSEVEYRRRRDGKFVIPEDKFRINIFIS
jgi:hypothetical protein